MIYPATPAGEKRATQESIINLQADLIETQTAQIDLLQKGAHIQRQRDMGTRRDEAVARLLYAEGFSKREIIRRVGRDVVRRTLPKAVIHAG